MLRNERPELALGLDDTQSLNGADAQSCCELLDLGRSVLCRADSDILQTGVSNTNALRCSPFGEFKCPAMTDGGHTCLLRPPRLTTRGSEKGDQQQCGLHRIPRLGRRRV